jgi:hypothetical protein
MSIQIIDSKVWRFYRIGSSIKDVEHWQAWTQATVLRSETLEGGKPFRVFFGLDMAMPG